MSDAPEINRPEVWAEVSAVFQRYEAALVGNRVEELDRLFWNSDHTVRYGATENLVGYAAIQAFRAGRSPQGLARQLGETVITTFGRDFATACTLFTREGQAGAGRQTQTWVRWPGLGWQVVAAHVSWLKTPAEATPPQDPAPATV